MLKKEEKRRDGDRHSNRDRDRDKKRDRDKEEKKREKDDRKESANKKEKDKKREKESDRDRKKDRDRGKDRDSASRDKRRDKDSSRITKEKTYLKDEEPINENDEKPVTAIRRSAIPAPVQSQPSAKQRAEVVPVEPEIKQQQEQAEEEADDYDYDDDFEDYDDDDFESEDEEDEGDEDEDEDLVVVAGKPYPVVDDDADDAHEGKMRNGDGHGGNYEKARRQREISEVKAAMIRENSAKPNSRANRHSEDSRPSKEHGKHSESQKAKMPPRKSSAVGFNFASAKERQKSQVASNKARKRGDALLTMIRLDYAKYDLFELPPIPYDALMGNANRVQATSQTGEDDLEAEVQTEAIKTLEKWTQNPPPPLTSLPDPNDQEAVVQALHGVGGQMEVQDVDQKTMKAVDSVRLSKFLESASQAIITLLEEDDERRFGSSKEAQEQKDVVFSNRVTLLPIEEIDCLQHRQIIDLAFASDQPSLIVAAHGPVNPTDLDASLSIVDYRSYLTVWNVSSPSQPLHVLVTSGSVTKVCFSPFKASMAFAGMEKILKLSILLLHSVILREINFEGLNKVWKNHITLT